MPEQQQTNKTSKSHAGHDPFAFWNRHGFRLGIFRTQTEKWGFFAERAAAFSYYEFVISVFEFLRILYYFCKKILLFIIF
jgi:hypothetical protein